MISRKILYYFAFFFTLTLFTLSGAFAFPTLEFDQSTLAPGSVTLSPEISSGTQVELRINEQFVQEKEVFATSKVVLLNESIVDIQIPLGATLILKNNRATTYNLLVNSEEVSLEPNEEVSFSFSELGIFELEDEDTGNKRVINVQDSLVTVNFEEVENFLKDGVNTINFLVKHPSPEFDLEEEFIFSVNYEKFPNDIFLNPFQNITNSSEVTLSGFVEDARFPLFFVLNLDGELVNPGVLQNIPLDGNNFSVTISGLRQGNNSIRLITTESPTNLNLFTGEKRVKVLSDRIPPEIEILEVNVRSSGGIIQEEGNNILSTENSLELVIGTDGENLSFVFDNRTEGPFEVVEGNVTLSLNLEEGLNPLTIIVEDEAQNVAKLQKAIRLDSEEPDLIEDTLSPPEMFSGGRGDARFFFPRIEGRTTEPNVEMTIVTFNEDARDLDGRPLSCPMFENIVFRNLGQLDDEEPDGPELNLNETQLSLLDQLSFEFNTRSDSSGNFDAVIVLQEKSFDEGDFDDFRNRDEDEQREVGDVSSDNTICFYLQDSFGNRKIRSFDVELDAGNTEWRVDQITTVPNSVFAAEIEQRGDSRTGNPGVEFGMLAVFQYIGGGEVTQIQTPQLRIDRGGSEESKFVDLQNQRQNFLFEKDTGRLTVFIPVEVEPLGKNPLDYPDDLTLAFQMKLSYEVDDLDIPVDTQNPVFFQTKINIERPLDHTRFLTPETIDGIIEVLDSAIEVTETLTNFMRTASVFGVIGCTAAKIWHAYEVSEIEGTLDGPERIEALNEADENLYLICDRVACTGAPPVCDPSGSNNLLSTEGQEELNKFVGNNSKGDLDLDLEGANAQLTNAEGEVIGLLDEVEIDGRCTLPNDQPGIKSGYYIKTEGKLVERETSTSIRGTASFIESEKTITGFQCLEANELKNLQPSSVGGGICYSPGAPHFDDTRCVIPGVTEPQSDRDPASGIISSVSCGCVTDTYSHLNNYLKIEKSIKQCLEQAKIGEVEGSYCERLLSQSVCDIATNEILPEVVKHYRSSPGNTNSLGNRDLNFFDTIQNTEKAFNQRYAGSIFTQGGLGGTQLVNKACIGAITGDFSVLTENILTAIDQNEVDPVFGPAFPESRMQGFNPLTGDLSIQYRFTYGVVSGGQRINTEVKLACDPAQPNGEFCPPTYLEVDEIGGRNIGTQRVRAGDAVSELVVLTDPSAQFWFNSLILEHTFDIKGETKRLREEFPIVHKGEVVPQCSFGAGPSLGFAFKCDLIFSEDALISQFRISDTTEMFPSSRFFPGNDVQVKLDYDIRSTEGDQDEFFLHYFASCPAVSGTAAIFGNQEFKLDEISELEDFRNPRGSEILTLFELEEFATRENGGFIRLDGSSQPSLEKGTTYEIVVVNQDTTQGKSGTVRVSASSGLDNSKLGEKRFTSLDAGSGKEKVVHTFTVGQDARVRGFSVEIRDATGVVISLREKDKSTPIEEYFFSSSTSGNFGDIRDIRPGTCTVEMKILPDVEQFSTKEEFDELGLNGEDIISDAVDEAFKLSFSLAENTDPGERPQIVLKLFEPEESQSFCFQKSGSRVSFPAFSRPEVKLVLQSSSGPFEKSKYENLKIDIDVLSDTIAGSLLESPVSDETFDNSIQDFLLDFNTIKFQNGELGRVDAKLIVTVEGNAEGREIDEKFERKLFISECGENFNIDP